MTADNNDKGGLSTFEKALVLGLGAVAVGAILKNGDKVVSNSGDRVVVQRDGELRVLKNDDVLLRQPGAQLATRTFDDGSTLTTVTRDDGSVVTTVPRAADGTVLRRSLTRADGTEVALIDDLDNTTPVEVSSLPPVPQETVSTSSVALTDQAALQAALTASLRADTAAPTRWNRCVTSARSALWPRRSNWPPSRSRPALPRSSKARRMNWPRLAARSVRSSPTTHPPSSWSRVTPTRWVMRATTSPCPTVAPKLSLWLSRSTFRCRRKTS